MKFLFLSLCCGSFALKVNFHEHEGLECTTAWEIGKSCQQGSDVQMIEQSPEEYKLFAGALTAQGSSEEACRLICESYWDSWIDGVDASGFTDYSQGPPGGYTYSTVIGAKQVSKGCCYYLPAALSPPHGACMVNFLTRTDRPLTAAIHFELGTDTWGGGATKSFLMGAACATGLGGDQHITNVKGESFDILQSGTFSILSLFPKTFGVVSRNPLLHVSVNIVRIDDACSEAYIQNMTLKGSWVTEMGHNLIQIRGNIGFVEVKFNDTWSPASSISSTSVNSSSSKLLHIKVNEVTMMIDILNYNKANNYDAQSNVRKLGWSFLNIRFNGIKRLNMGEYVDVQGLIGNEDYHAAAEPPEGCLQLMKNGGGASRTLASKIRLG